MTLEVGQPAGVGDTQAAAQGTDTGGSDGSLDAVLAERSERRQKDQQDTTAAAEAQPDVEADGDGVEGVADAEAEEVAVDAMEGESPELDETSSASEGESEADSGEGADDPSITPPHFWDADGKAHFATLDPVTQRFVAEQDRKAQAFVTQEQQRLRTEADASRRAMQDSVRTKLEQFDTAIEMAETLGQERQFTDGELRQLLDAGQITADQAMSFQFRRKEAAEKVEALKRARDQEDTAWRNENSRERNAYLRQHNPDVIAAAREVAAYVHERGVTAEQLDYASGPELEMAYESMMWRKSQTARAKAKRAPKRPAPTAKPAKAARPTTQTAEADTLARRAAQTGDLEDVLAARKARRQAARSANRRR